MRPRFRRLDLLVRVADVALRSRRRECPHDWKSGTEIGQLQAGSAARSRFLGPLQGNPTAFEVNLEARGINAALALHDCVSSPGGAEGRGARRTCPSKRGRRCPSRHSGRYAGEGIDHVRRQRPQQECRRRVLQPRPLQIALAVKDRRGAHHAQRAAARVTGRPRRPHTSSDIRRAARGTRGRRLHTP